MQLTPVGNVAVIVQVPVASEAKTSIMALFLTRPML